MSETKRIIQLFEKLYNDSPWIDVTILDTLKNITASEAAKKVAPDCNSIWEIINHLIMWRMNVLQRVQGKVLITPANNYFEKVNDTSDAAWKVTLLKLKISQDEWIALLKNFNEIDFTKVYANNNMNYYEHIHGIIQHDAYHLGQITLLVKFIRN